MRIWISIGLVAWGLFAVSAVKASPFLPKPSVAPGSAPRSLPFQSALGGFDGIPDTLEIVVLYVEFRAEQPEDNPSTTGNGTFNSALETEWNLDPGGFRKHEAYLAKHLEFAKDYFDKVSNGRLVLRWRFFPTPDANGEVKTPYQLNNRMTAYNPERKDEEKRVVFFERKAQALMSFVAESIKKANEGNDPARNPFLLPALSGDHAYRSYLIFHAGHNGLIDGGRLGQLGADTPNDIIDFFATPDDFTILKDLPEDVSGNLAATRADSSGVEVSGGKRIREIMVLSESASQDEVNFGINGILVNQIARQIGMPDTWDRGTGFTQLGYFDLMDVGHLSLSGFVPVFPSAWIRYFMGWEEPVLASPSDSGASEYRIFSPMLVDSAGENILSVKVPINDREYLLVENRQRALDDSVTVYFSRQANEDDNAFSVNDSVRVPLLFMDSLFLDSLCDDRGRDCEPNDRQPKGIITGVSSYDIGLPSSGLLVWHINDWFIEETARFGFVNASDEDTKELLGINLVEADGDLAIGQEGKDQLGQSVFDFGSGSDMLPHYTKHRESEDDPWRMDTVRFITPFGHANTGSWNDGRTPVVLEGVLPRETSILPSVNFVNGDSVFNFVDSSLVLRVHWDASTSIQLKNSWKWPVRTARAVWNQGIHVLRPGDASYVLSASDEGYLEVFDNTGRGGVAAYDTLRLDVSYDSLSTLLPSGLNRDTLKLPLYSTGAALGRPLGSVVIDDTLSCILSASGSLHFTALNASRLDSLNVIPNDSAYVRTSVDVNGVLGPMVTGSLVWVVTEGGELAGYGVNAQEQVRIELPGHSYHSMAAVQDAGGDNPGVVLSASGGRVVVADLTTETSEEISDGSWVQDSQFFSTVTSDFDRNGTGDILVLGARGRVTLLNRDGSAFPNFPATWPRSTSIVDTTGKVVGVTQDPSAPAVSDLNGDGYPDIIFTGVNTVEAYQYTGAVVSGWPFQFEERQDVGLLYSNNSFPASVVFSTPLVTQLDEKTTVLAASPDGLIWAVDSKGNPLQSSGFSENSEYARYMGIPSTNTKDWPLAAGGLTFDTTVVPYVNITLASIDGSDELELLAQTGSGHLYAWGLTDAVAGDNQWLAPGGSFHRNHFFDADPLDEPETVSERNVIRDFHLFPSPLTGSTVRIHLDIGAPARKARIRFYDLGGAVVKDQTITGLPQSGLQPYHNVNLSHLGPDVYTALMEVWFEDGTVKKKFTRLGVIR